MNRLCAVDVCERQSGMRAYVCVPAQRVCVSECVRSRSCVSLLCIHGAFKYEGMSSCPLVLSPQGTSAPLLRRAIDVAPPALV